MARPAGPAEEAYAQLAVGVAIERWLDGHGDTLVDDLARAHVRPSM
ncbi:hypothetical protein [Actinopolymorpha alba]|nr:hypothetical protein [Actinopolymorpha alba]